MTKYVSETADLADVVMTGEELMEATSLAVKAVSTDFATRVTFAGEGAFTNGSDVNLPSIPMDAKVTKRAALVLAGYAGHEALHKQLSDFNRLQPLFEQAKIDNKWLTTSLANGMEDVRIEHGGTVLYGGIAQSIDKTAREVTRKFIDEVYPANPDIVDDFGKVGPVAITWEGRRRLGYPDPSNEEALNLLPKKIRRKVEKIVDQVMNIPHGVTDLGKVDKYVAYNGSIEAFKLAQKIANAYMKTVIRIKRDEWEKENPPLPPQPPEGPEQEQEIEIIIEGDGPPCEDGDGKGKGDDKDDDDNEGTDEQQPDEDNPKGEGEGDGSDGEGDGEDEPDGETGAGDSDSDTDGEDDEGDDEGDEGSPDDGTDDPVEPGNDAGEGEDESNQGDSEDDGEEGDGDNPGETNDDEEVDEDGDENQDGESVDDEGEREAEDDGEEAGEGESGEDGEDDELGEEAGEDGGTGEDAGDDDEGSDEGNEDTEGDVDADDGVDESVDDEGKTDGPDGEGDDGDGSDEPNESNHEMQRNDGGRDTDGPDDDDDDLTGRADVGPDPTPFDPKSIKQPEPIEPGLQEAMEREVNEMKQQNGGRGYIILDPSADTWVSRKEITDDAETKRYGRVWYNESKNAVSASVGTVRRKLERVVTAMSRTYWENNKRTGKLDVRRNVSKIVNLKNNVFRNKVDELNLNTALSILIDMSGSMGGGKDTMAQQITIAVAEALAPVGVPLEVLGHHTVWSQDQSHSQHVVAGDTQYGRYNPIWMWQFKDFDDSMGACRSSMGTIERRGGGANADGDAILWAGKRLYLREEEKKILFVLSDGQPAYHSDTRCVHQYTRDAVEWCVYRGIDVMGLGMLDDSVKQYYPKYVTVDDMDQFGKTYIDEIVKLMLGRALPDQSILINSTARRNSSI